MTKNDIFRFFLEPLLHYIDGQEVFVTSLLLWMMLNMELFFATNIKKYRTHMLFTGVIALLALQWIIRKAIGNV